ncbi:hypothetical protein CVIRNUC_006681 [Coccomyxa viridis]|uniref:Uncharacterized protein n=1 Tax=Coccomyxa viridis TaxID=1274662 RepID=A0AAV1I8R5_9CHLO|nr:hypothetical protein CVIRNUC_006681 [Coccomyxa viridis]
MTTSASSQVAGVTAPRLTCTGLSWLPTRHACPPAPDMHSTKRGSHVARSSSGVLSRDTNSMSTCWAGQDRPRPAPQPQPDFSGGGNGGRPRVSVGHSGDGGDDDDSFEGLSLHWNPIKAVAGGVQARVTADPAFAFKLGCECCLDLAIIMAVNLAHRRDRILKDIDYVLSQCCTSLLCDLALVYLLAPTLAPSRMPASRLGRSLARLPAHMFQSAPPGQPRFTLAQRAGCFCSTAVRYGALGFLLGCIRTSMVHTIAKLRMRMDPASRVQPAEQPLVGSGPGRLCFRGLVSIMRYSAINAAEDMLCSRCPGTQSLMASAVLRLFNKLSGPHVWMLYARP